MRTARRYYMLLLGILGWDVESIAGRFKLVQYATFEVAGAEICAFPTEKAPILTVPAS